MRLGPKIISATSLILAALGCWYVATLAADIIEERSGQAVAVALIEAEHDWADVHTDGLQVHIGGIAPTEARRFNALHVAGKMVDATRIVDGTTIEPSKPLAPPRYSIEILRNDEGITLIGLVPESLNRPEMVAEINALAQGAEVIDLLESASYPEPRGWTTAVDFGIEAVGRLPRSKVSISAGAVHVTAISNSEAEKQQLESALARRVPKSIALSFSISAPRPVITPFTLRFLVDSTGARFDACSVDNTREREKIVEAAVEAGLEGEVDCTLGLGVPTPDWADAVVLGIAAVAETGGSVTFSDADVTLVATEETPQAVFDRVVGELESNLPDVFSLSSVLPEKPEVAGEDDADGPAVFTATRSPEGQVQLRGRINNDVVRETVTSFAKARFGHEDVYMAARIDEDLPPEWPVRVLAALQSLAELSKGAAVVQEDVIEIHGTTGDKDARAEIARILSEKLGEAQNYSIDVTYDEALDPVAALPTPDECVDQINEILAASKITFAPGSTDIEASAIGTVNQIADVLKQCKDVDMSIEIAGHTDSQGREEMNLDLSQKRSDAVLEALVARRVLTSKIAAMGYGESTPIADNETEEGREANRRIEFRLITPETEARAEDARAADAAAETAEDAGTSGEQATVPDADTTTEDTAEATDESADAEADLDATSGAADDTEHSTEDNQ
ncbi:OOP family OmpA-OmpF porin [Aliiruegeria haliotis]|uniref:OOP family OmpA-OmpF porin n=1 Tax=Aliiruegeria haliotis TaxID=1280846 RepID=A0A2T0RRT2_9RHOB|nr:OmpA family protein [Aliiruegeria haliotis]PRY23827.1 OOP family OmpA-OmpF porin [Aliiruegeria haliotis]